MEAYQSRGSYDLNSAIDIIFGSAMQRKYVNSLDKWHMVHYLGGVKNLQGEMPTLEGWKFKQASNFIYCIHGIFVVDKFLLNSLEC